MTLATVAVHNHSRMLEVERDIRLVKRAMQRTNEIRILLDGYDTRLSYDLFNDPYYKLRERLGQLLLVRDDLEESADV